MGEGNSDVSEMLRKYTIMDKVFVIFVRTILILGEKCADFEEDIDPAELY